MKNIRVFYLKIFSFFGGEIFHIFEQACFRNESDLSNYGQTDTPNKAIYKESSYVRYCQNVFAC